jgi:hypothetical protein
MQDIGEMQDIDDVLQELRRKQTLDRANALDNEVILESERDMCTLFFSCASMHCSIASGVS